MGLFSKLFGPKVATVHLKQRFDIVGPIGAGTMSKVFKARDLKLGRPVVLKVLDREQTTKLEARFPGLNKPTEGTMAVPLDHPRLVRTLDHGLSTDSEQFLVMEIIEGYPLKYYIDARNDEWRTHRLNWMIELGEALAYLHSQKLIHRDFCPRNVLVTSDLHIKLIDFGLCVPNTPPFRKPGNRTGTVNYMAPELIRRQPTDERIDVYSYAVTCYELCSGRLPWDSAKSMEALMSHLNTPPADLAELCPELDEAVVAAIMRGLDGSPNRRWPSAGAMVAALREATGVAV